MNQRKKATNEAKHRTHNVLLVVLTGLIASFFVISFTLQNSRDITINVIALIIMFGFIGYGLNIFGNGIVGLRALWQTSNDFSVILKAMDESKYSVWRVLEELLSDEKQIKSAILHQTFKDLLKEYDAISEQSGQEMSNTLCDIEVFINEDLLDDIGNASYSEFVSSALTGLGILGTFVGLALSLQSFETGSAEAINNSIAPLIDGIKIAFYTSIFGVSLSLVYGLLVRDTMLSAQYALKRFLSGFHKYAGPRAEHETMSQLLGYQKTQTDSMRKFAEDISISLGDVIEKKLTPAFSALPNQIASELQNSIVPSINSMEKSMDSLLSSVAQTQSTGVDKMVNHFIDEMDRMLGGQMENLGSSISALCDWQKQTIEQLETVINNVRTNAENLTAINQSLEDSLTHFDAYITHLDKAQANSDERTLTTLETMEQVLGGFKALSTRFDEILAQGNSVFACATETSETMQKQYTLTQTVIEEQREWLKANAKMSKEQMAQATEVYQLQTDTIKATSASVTDELKSITTDITGELKTLSTDVTGGLKELSDGMASDLQTASADMSQVAKMLSEELDASMRNTYTQFDKELALAVQHFNGTLTNMKTVLAELETIVENTPKLLEGSASTTQQQMDTYLKDSAQLQVRFIGDVDKAIQAMSENLKQIQTTPSAVPPADTTEDHVEEVVL